MNSGSGLRLATRVCSMFDIRWLQIEGNVDKTTRALADWRTAEAKSKRQSHAAARENEKLQDASLDIRFDYISRYTEHRSCAMRTAPANIETLSDLPSERSRCAEAARVSSMFWLFTVVCHAAQVWDTSLTPSWAPRELSGSRPPPASATPPSCKWRRGRPRTPSRRQRSTITTFVFKRKDRGESMIHWSPLTRPAS